MVTTDNVALPSNAASAASKPASSTSTADAPPLSPPAAPALAVAAANQPERADTAPARRRQRQEAREQQRRERREARQQRFERAYGSDRRQREVNDQPASERYAGANAGEGRGTDRTPRGQNRWENDDNERDVTVTQTYQMRDGRRVTVTRTFRSAADRERYEAQGRFGRRPYVRYHPAAPQAYIVAD